MVRFTLRDVMGSASIRLELDPGDAVGEISCIANECWGLERFMLCREYMIMDEDSSIGSCISEGDVVDLIPDPRFIRGHVLHTSVVYCHP